MKKVTALTVTLVLLVLSLSQVIYASNEGIFGDMGVVGILLKEHKKYTPDDFPGIDIEKMVYDTPITISITLTEKTRKTTDHAMTIISDVIGDNISFIRPDYKTIAVGDLMWINGDADGDWDCDLTDVSITLKYIAKWDITLDSYAFGAVDIYRDGKITLVDVTIMMKKIAGWDQSKWLPAQ